ncbi:MAG: ROK family protein [Dehalococcoidia bacterium]|nr:ROK family protein [Dehalococcoidia bacterium]
MGPVTGDTDLPEPVLVAVDFTATALRIVLVDSDGEVVEREQYELGPLPDEAAWAWEVGGRIATSFAREGQKRWAQAIAVACPGMVDPIAGILVESSGQAEWNGLHVVDALRRHIDAPVVALNRVQAALRGEWSAGAADGTMDAMYVCLRGVPQAAVLSNGRILSGAGHRAGALPALPELDPAQALEGEVLEQVTGILADLAALLDPVVVILDGEEAHVGPLGPVLQGVLDEVSPGARVVRPALADGAALLGALKAAEILAYEGDRTERLE